MHSMKPQAVPIGSGATDPPTARSIGALERGLTLVTALLVAGLLGYKWVLTSRLNINWDEFYFLSHVYSLIRGDLVLLLQGAYTHVFTWLPALGGDEVHQINAARAVMVALLALTVLLLWRLGRIWLDALPAVVVLLVYLTAAPIMMHGASFRVDSLLAPLTVAALLLVARRGDHRHGDMYAGLLLGVAFALSVKTVLLAPLLISLVWNRPRVDLRMPVTKTRAIALSLGRIAIAACLTATVLIVLHWISLSSADVEKVSTFATQAATKTLLDTPLFARVGFLKIYLHWQPLPWLLIALGTAAALIQRRFDLASLALSLLPIVVYRNAFPYYYLVMLAPASVLAGHAIQTVASYLSKSRPGFLAMLAVGAIWAGLLHQGGSNISRLLVDGQDVQRAVVSGVHEIFPEPVNYVDRCGMIASYPKVNLFMSTWGMENYRLAGRPFMPEAIDRRAAFVLVNHGALNPDDTSNGSLLPLDRAMIARYYPAHWGPVRVAGAEAVVTAGRALRLAVPFTAQYRVESKETDVFLDGQLRRDGAIVMLSQSGFEVRLPEAGGVTKARVRFILAAARPPPAAPSPIGPLFWGL